MRPLIVGNWKCNPTTLVEAKRLFNLVKIGVKKIRNTEVVICPPFPYLAEFFDRCRKIQHLKLGAQDCFWEEKGAFTGEVSPKMLKDLNCEYIIIGHSERRRYFRENNEMINKKIKAVLNFGLKPILCIGETEKERKKGKAKEILKEQLQKGTESIKNLVVAYEPVWAIGTGKACGITEAKEAYSFIKRLAKNVPILYGGGVNSQNARDFIKKVGFQGLLVGGASLNPQEFTKIVKAVSSIPKCNILFFD
jgi:triosephosphate isomerase